MFYTSSSNPFGGVVFAYTKTHIRIWIPKRGNGASPANGISFFFSVVRLWKHDTVYISTGHGNISFTCISIGTNYVRIKDKKLQKVKPLISL